MTDNDLPPLKSGWEIMETKKYPGRVYYYNESTKESTWSRPSGYSKSDNNQPRYVFVDEILVMHSESPSNINTKTKISREAAFKKIKELTEKYDVKNEFDKCVHKIKNDSKCANKNGEIGWIQRNTFPPEFEKVAWSLPIGKVSDIVETVEGFHIIRRRG